MKRHLRDNGLSILFLVLFLATLAAQALVGHADFNHEQVAHQDAPVPLGRYVTSSAFAVDLMENWQSEYLQFTLFILATVWLVQRGSTESKDIGEGGGETDEQQKLGDHVVLLMTAIWLASWFAQLVTGRVAFNQEQLDHQQAPLTLAQYAGSSDFWIRTVQNWQSEFLAVASMVLFSIWLRQRGSAQSKPVGDPHGSTASEG